MCPSKCKRERPSVEEHCLPTSKYQFYNLFHRHLHSHFISPLPNSFCAFHQLSKLSFKFEARLPPRSRFPFKPGPRVAACQTVPPAQIKILGVRVRLSFATAETELVCFFFLSNHWQWFCQGARVLAGKSARVGGRAEAAVAGRRPGTSHLCRPAAALSPAPARPAPGSIHCCTVPGRGTPARHQHSQLASLLPGAVLTRDSSQTPFKHCKEPIQPTEREST